MTPRSKSAVGTKRPPVSKRAQRNCVTLRLYVAGTTPQSTRAIVSAREFCDEYLAGRYQLEVVDIYQRPTLARDEQIVAVPTLVKQLPLPLRRLVGDLSMTERVLIGLDLVEGRKS